MQQDFSGQNLRGRDFKDQDLTGANFSHADIRGANFTNAKLISANFSHAKAGLQRRQAIFLVAVSFFIATLLGVFAGVGGFATATFLLIQNIKLYFTPAAIVLIVLSMPSIFIVQQGYAKAKEVWGASSGDNALFSLSLSLAVLGVVFLVFAIFLTIFENYALAVVLVIFSILSLIVFALSSVGQAGVGEVAYFLALVVALAGVVAIVGAIALVGVRNGFLNITLAIKIGVVVAVFMGVIAIYVGIKARSGYYFSYIRMIVVNFAALGGTSFRRADLTKANFSHASLKSTDFREAKLNQTCFFYSKNLHQSRQENPNYSMLSNPQIRDLIVRRKGQNKSYNGANLKGAYLKGADLSYANLRGADISGANLQEACLEWANLTQAQAIGTDFTSAQMTGACLEAWNIESNTKLDNVDCRFVYLQENPKPGTDDRERRPSSGEFKPREFTKLFEEVLNTVDLIFDKGIDWKAFTIAFDKVRTELIEGEGTEIAVQGIETKGDGVFVVRVSVPSDANKENIHSDLTQNYDLALKAVEEKYKVELQAKDREIQIYHETYTDMKEITRWLAKNQVIVNNEVRAISESKSMSEAPKYDQRGAQFAGGFAETVQGDQIGGNIHNYAAQQNLAEAAAEIKQLLEQLEKDYPTNTLVEKATVAEEAIKQIENNPTLKQRIVAALKTFTIEAFKEAVDNPIINVMVPTLESWQKGE